MSNKIFYIYQCIAKRSDNTEIERIFKIPSFWNYELLSMALITTCDSPGIVKYIEIESEGTNFIIDEYENMSIIEGMPFEELFDKDMIIKLVYEDGITTAFNCKYIGCDMVEKRITRKTPILISIHGYNRLSKKEHFEQKTNYPLLPDSYENGEELSISWAKNDITRNFTFYTSIYFYSLKNIGNKYMED